MIPEAIIARRERLQVSAREQLVIDLAMILAPATKSRLIIHITEDREIDVNVRRLADALIAAGYSKGNAA